jgi:hypothetical protein
VFLVLFEIFVVFFLSLLSLIELANNMAKLSQHCGSQDKNLVHWLI